ncbi:MAG TPA: S8 family serine peptidase, partial [candidate division Zixibacteria bacterium]|nr:S8 family serine peptidase [candidate division Zixibacteria bacterium]
MIRNSKKIIFSLFLSSFFIISLLPQNFLDISSANVNDTLEDDFVINPIVKTNPKFDVNKNKIQDKLEKSLVANPEEEITVIVTFNTPLNSDLRKKIELLGGEIQSEWSIFYGAPIKIRSKDVFFLSSIANIEFIRENTLCYPFLSTTTQQVNVRPYVWETLGLEGNSEHAIAILDSGIDDSHPDLAGKIIHWEDFIGKDWYTEDDEYTEPIDLLGHGSHCASIACGSGEAG